MNSCSKCFLQFLYFKLQNWLYFDCAHSSAGIFRRGGDPCENSVGDAFTHHPMQQPHDSPQENLQLEAEISKVLRRSEGE